MKKLLIFFGGLIVVVIVLVVITLYNLGPLIEKGVNTFGPKMTQTEVRVRDVDVALLSGKAELQGFVLGNPEGLSKNKAMTVDAVRVNIDEKTVTQNPIVIREIRAVSPIINYEVKGKTDNFRAILHNVEQAAVTAIIVDQLYQKIQSDAVKQALAKQLKDLDVDLEQFQLSPGEKVKDLGKEAEDAIKNKMKEFLGK